MCQYLVTIIYLFIRSDQIVLAKSPAVWYQPDVNKVLLRHREHLPDIKILLIVRDPIG